MNKLSETEIAWLAGLFEGEGNIYRNPNHSAGAYQIRLVMVDEDIINRVRDLVGEGTCVKQKKYDGRQQAYRWNLAKYLEVKNFLEIVWPYLGKRRKIKALEAITNITKYEKFKSKKLLSINHGTYGGYQKHTRLKEKPCEDCKNARKKYRKSKGMG